MSSLTSISPQNKMSIKVLVLFYLLFCLNTEQCDGQFLFQNWQYNHYFIYLFLLAGFTKTQKI